MSGATSFFAQYSDYFAALHILLRFPLPRPSVPSDDELDRNVTSRLKSAQHDEQGRARLALVAALAQIPGWNQDTLQEPQPAQVSAIQSNQVESLFYVAPFVFYIQEEVQERAGGSTLSTTGVNYRSLLTAWPQRGVIAAAYRRAGLSLDADLAQLNAAPPLVSTPQGTAYLKRSNLSGALRVPLFTIHTIGDDLVPVTVENAYHALIESNNELSLLRQAYVGRYGHCNFSPAEQIVAIGAVLRRIKTGAWGDVSPVVLNAQARALGASMNVIVDEKNTRHYVDPKFVIYDPPSMQR